MWSPKTPWKLLRVAIVLGSCTRDDPVVASVNHGDTRGFQHRSWGFGMTLQVHGHGYVYVFVSIYANVKCRFCKYTRTSRGLDWHRWTDGCPAGNCSMMASVSIISLLNHLADLMNHRGQIPCRWISVANAQIRKGTIIHEHPQWSTFGFVLIRAELLGTI